MSASTIHPGVNVSGKGTGVFPPSSLPAYQWVWANATERLAQTVTAQQIGGVGYQTDMELQFRLLGLASGGMPTEWGQLLDPSVTSWRTLIAPQGNATITATGLATLVASGTANLVVPTNTNRATALSGSLVRSAAPAGSLAIYRGQGSTGPYPLQGLRYIIEFMLEEVCPTLRWYAGIVSPTPGANDTPINFTNTMGIGTTDASANAQLVHNDAAGAAVPVDLGAGFPARVAGTGFKFQFFTRTGTSWGVMWRNIATGAEASTTLVADLPTATLTQSLCFYGCNNLDASVISIRIGSLAVGQRSC